MYGLDLLLSLYTVDLNDNNVAVVGVHSVVGVICELILRAYVVYLIILFFNMSSGSVYKSYSVSICRTLELMSFATEVKINSYVEVNVIVPVIVIVVVILNGAEIHRRINKHFVESVHGRKIADVIFLVDYARAVLVVGVGKMCVAYPPLAVDLHKIADGRSVEGHILVVINGSIVLIGKDACGVAEELEQIHLTNVLVEIGILTSYRSNAVSVVLAVDLNKAGHSLHSGPQGLGNCVYIEAELSGQVSILGKYLVKVCIVAALKVHTKLSVCRNSCNNVVAVLIEAAFNNNVNGFKLCRSGYHDSVVTCDSNGDCVDNDLLTELTNCGSGFVKGKREKLTVSINGEAEVSIHRNTVKSVIQVSEVVANRSAAHRHVAEHHALHHHCKLIVEVLCSNVLTDHT